jgi:hypothetical protein
MRRIAMADIGRGDDARIVQIIPAEGWCAMLAQRDPFARATEKKAMAEARPLVAWALWANGEVHGLVAGGPGGASAIGGAFDSRHTGGELMGYSHDPSEGMEALRWKSEAEAVLRRLESDGEA